MKVLHKGHKVAILEQLKAGSGFRSRMVWSYITGTILPEMKWTYWIWSFTKQNGCFPGKRPERKIALEV